MKKEPTVYLLHISEAIESLEKNIEGMTEKQFYASEVVRGFVERKLEIIGEATKRIPEEFKNQYPDIPWAEMAATRNILIHEYEDVDSAIVWDTVTQHLLPLKKQIEEILKKETDETE
jgi:uncharacterized protein with HEPN domain